MRNLNLNGSTFIPNTLIKMEIDDEASLALIDDGNLADFQRAFANKVSKKKF